MIQRVLSESGFAVPVSDVRLLTNLRYWGHCFNPISVYYCFERDAEKPVAAVLEVTNTPWGQRHMYVVPMRGAVLETSVQ